MDILNKIDELKYKKARTKYLQQVISRIGTIEEKEDCIICYVKQELLEKNGKRVFYELQCNGMNTVYDKSKKIVEYFKLNKPVYYIFDGITFDTVVNISSLFANITFKNCTFNMGIRCFFADSITFENNKYNCWTEFKDYGNAFLYGKINNLRFEHEQFVNNSEFHSFDNNFGINVETNKITIICSNIQAGNNGQINIKANETILQYSKMIAPEIYLDSNNAFLNESFLEAKGVIIESKNYKCHTTTTDFCSIRSPYTVYNGTEITTDHNENKELKENRLKLVKTLKNVINKCNQSTLVKSASEKNLK